MTAEAPGTGGEAASGGSLGSRATLGVTRPLAPGRSHEATDVGAACHTEPMSRQDANDLTARLADLLRREQAAMAEFLVALADFDRRRLWLDLGYPGLFLFLHRELGLSKGAAHFRKVAAKLVQRFPEVVEPLRDGRLCISSVVELARVATRENLAEVLPRFFHRSRREAREVAVEISPASVVPRREVTTPVEVRARGSAPGGQAEATRVCATGQMGNVLE